MDYNSVSLIVDEVLDFFVRADEETIASIKGSLQFKDAVYQTISKKDTDRYEEKEWQYYGSYRPFNHLSFITKGKLFLSTIFNMSEEECSAVIKDALARARCKLMEKSGQRVDERTLEVAKSSWAKENTREKVESDYDELSNLISNGKEEYERCLRKLDEVPDYRLDYYDREVDEWRTVIDSYEKDKERYAYNTLAIGEMRQTEDEIYLLQNGFIISPKIFKECNLGFDFSKLRFNEIFARNYASQIDIVKTDLHKLKPWEKEVCRLGGMPIKRSYKKKTGEPDKYGNVQVSIFDNPDAPNYDDESE